MEVMSTCRILLVVIVCVAAFDACLGSRQGHRYQPVQPLVTRDTGACSYVINIPAPETPCQHFEYRNEMERLKERLSVLESRLSDLLDSRVSVPAPGPYVNGYSSEETFSSSEVTTERKPGEESGLNVDSKSPPPGVFVPQYPMPPLREVTPLHNSHVPYYPGVTPQRGKPPQEDLVAPQNTMIPLRPTDTSDGDRQPKKPATITSTKPGSSQSVIGNEGDHENAETIVAGTTINETSTVNANENRGISVADDAAVSSGSVLHENHNNNEDSEGNSQGTSDQVDVIQFGEAGPDPRPTDQISNLNSSGSLNNRGGHQFSLNPDGIENQDTNDNAKNTGVSNNASSGGEVGIAEPSGSATDSSRVDQSESRVTLDDVGQINQTTNRTGKGYHDPWIISVDSDHIEDQGNEDTEQESQSVNLHVGISSSPTDRSTNQDDNDSVVPRPPSDHKNLEEAVLVPTGDTGGPHLSEETLSTRPPVNPAGGVWGAGASVILDYLPDDVDYPSDEVASSSVGSEFSDDNASYLERISISEGQFFESVNDPEEEESESTAPKYLPDPPNLSPTSPEKSISTALQGGYSSFIFSSSDGAAGEGEEGNEEREDEGDGASPTRGNPNSGQEQHGVHPTDGDDGGPAHMTTETIVETTKKPFMGKMKTQDGHRGDLRKPRWKTFKERMDLRTLRGFLVMEGEKRPRPKGMGKPNDCIIDGCLCLRKKGHVKTGVYYLANPVGSGRRGRHVRLYCDMTTDGGGWTVIQQRQNGTTNFYRGWDDYAKGFGRLDGDFWIGNSMLHAMTANTNFMLRVEFTDWDGKLGYAEYDSFRVSGEADNFRLKLGYYLGGNAGDALSYHNDSQFSTRDRDNDLSGGSCSFLRQAGFWFKACNRANPNGRWLGQADARGLNGAVVTWGTWEGRKFTYCLKSFRMMIRSQNLLSALTENPKHRPGGPPETRHSRH